MSSDLKSMKITKSQQEKMSKPMPMDTPQYPWGLQIRLDNDSLKKLGISDLPKVGKKMMLVARVEVSSASQHTMKGGNDNMSVELQITDMCLESESESKDASKALYEE